jgi:hypothetical protein
VQQLRFRGWMLPRNSTISMTIFPSSLTRNQRVVPSRAAFKG